MRLYVGTLYTIENEFDECLQSINTQSYGDFDHHVFQNLPNKEAHITLFESFLERADKYGVLVKVDADMVLANENLFAGIVSKLEENNWAEILSIAVYDFFSDQLIWGLNAYRNSVRWDFQKENLFVDRPEVPPHKYLFDDNVLAPAAIHCKNPSPYQALHYGVHRALKVIQPGSDSKNEPSSKMHWNLLEHTWGNFQKTKDMRVGLAALGAELAYAGQFQVSDLDYSNPRVAQVLEKYLSLDQMTLTFEIKKRRFLNWGILPSRKRRRLLVLLAGRKNGKFTRTDINRGIV